MLFDETIHVHVGYYENNHEIEGIFLKVLNEDIWCLFYNEEEYEFKIPNTKLYPFLEGFGCLVGMYSITEGDLTQERGNEFLKQFIVRLSALN